MTIAIRVVSAFPAGRGDDAAALVFEYMAATQAETGRAVPAGIGELPAVLQRECRNLQSVYRPPGALLIADHGGHLPAASVWLSAPRSRPPRSSGSTSGPPGEATASPAS